MDQNLCKKCKSDYPHSRPVSRRCHMRYRLKSCRSNSLDGKMSNWCKSGWQPECILTDRTNSQFQCIMCRTKRPSYSPSMNLMKHRIPQNRLCSLLLLSSILGRWSRIQQQREIRFKSNLGLEDIRFLKGFWNLMSCNYCNLFPSHHSIFRTCNDMVLPWPPHSQSNHPLDNKCLQSSI